MMTFEDIAKILADVECDPYELRLDCIQCVRLKADGVEPYTPCPSAGGHSWFLQATLYRIDTITGDWGWGHGGKYFLSPHSTRDEVVKKALSACLAYAEHEVRESFKYRGKRVFGPHLSIEALWDVADRTEERV